MIGVPEAARREQGLSLRSLARLANTNVGTLARYWRQERAWDPTVKRLVVVRLIEEAAAVQHAGRAAERLVEAVKAYEAGDISREELKAVATNAREAAELIESRACSEWNLAGIQENMKQEKAGKRR